MNFINEISNMEKNRYFISDRIIEILYDNHDSPTVNKIVIDGLSIFAYTSKNKKIPNATISLTGLKKEKTFKMASKKFFHQQMKHSHTISFFISNRKTGKLHPGEISRISIEEIIGQYFKETNVKEFKLVFTEKKDMDKCVEIMEPVLVNLASKTFKNPYPAADTIISIEGGVVMVYRKNPPSGWAIPGGFINCGESAEEAAVREAKEETGLDIDHLALFGVFSDTERDPRFHTISIVYTGKGRGTPKSGDDASKVAIFSKNDLPGDIAFDHKKILNQYFKKRRI